MGLIYCLTSPSGKKYVGKTEATLAKRLVQHKSEATRTSSPKYVIHKAVAKYGIENFTIDVLVEAVDDPDLLSLLEIEFIASMKQSGITLYNSTIGGDGVAGRKATPDQNKRNSKQKLAYFDNPENRGKQSDAIRAAWQDEQKRSNLLTARIAAQRTPEFRQHLSERAAKYWVDNPTNGNCKLTVEDVKEIFARYQTGENKFSIANDFPVKPLEIYNIGSGRSWNHVTGIEKRGKSTNITVPEQQAADQD